VKPIRLTALIVAAAISVAIPAGASAASTTSSQITPTAPARLTTTTATSSAPLPNTGLNLLPETVAGIILVFTGVGMRLRRSRA
jgi:hypothetical protein